MVVQFYFLTGNIEQSEREKEREREREREREKEKERERSTLFIYCLPIKDLLC